MTWWPNVSNAPSGPSSSDGQRYNPPAGVWVVVEAFEEHEWRDGYFIRIWGITKSKARAEQLERIKVQRGFAALLFGPTDGDEPFVQMPDGTHWALMRDRHGAQFVTPTQQADRDRQRQNPSRLISMGWTDDGDDDPPWGSC